MLKIARYDDIMKEKFKRREQIKEIEYHAYGHCVHIGKISAACRICFTNELGGGIQVGQECMAKCPMCYYDRKRDDSREPQTSIDSRLADFFYNSIQPNWKPLAFSYQSTGETLLYTSQLEQFAMILASVDRKHNYKMYHHLYTNGILADNDMLDRLKAMDVHEIRFHVSASNFSKSVFKNMELAAKKGFIISIEEPSWPLHKEDLFKAFKVLENCGGKHLNIVEVQVTEYNIQDISKCYPDGRIYKDYMYHFYDEGLVYDIMEHVISKNYSFSVLDCNSGVERCRHGKFEKVPAILNLGNINDLDSMCLEFKG